MELTELNLHELSTSLKNRVLPKEEADEIKIFMQKKIDSPTLHTSKEMESYKTLKRFQLFINSNIAEHGVHNVLGGELLEGNDILTIDSKAKVGDDRYALADLVINGIEVEVKVAHTDTTKQTVISLSHNKPVVAIYVISPTGKKHWSFYVRPDRPDLNDIAATWENEMNTTMPVLPLLYFKELATGELEVTEMFQKR